jgi:hypothetical protein
MGYGNLDLDEIPTKQLRQELLRRTTLLREGKCPYCGGSLKTHTCKYRDEVETRYGVGWSSDLHRKVGEAVMRLTGSLPDELIEKINQIPDDRIATVTLSQLLEM